MNPVEGTVLGERYVLTGRIAVGGMGEVWAATDTVLDRRVAVKLLNPGLSQESDFVERFRAEARHTAALQHPNIATVFDYGEDDGTAYLVMELVPGRPLSQLIAERAPLSAQETVAILIQAATALAAAHEGGVVHRDVKPANILITPDGTVKLTDFGISRAVDSVPLTQTGQVLGTAQYLSPEQALGQSATAASDIYALGVVGHEMLTGERPFDTGSVVSTALAHVNNPPPPLPDTVPAGLRDVISSAMAKDPADRPASAADLAHSLGMPGAAFAPNVPVLPSLTASATEPAESPLTDSPLAAATSEPAESPLTESPLTEPVTIGSAAASPATNAHAPTQAMPAPTRAMPRLASPGGRGRLALLAGSLDRLRRHPSQPSRVTRRRSALLLAAGAVLGVLAFVTISQASGNGAAKPPLTPATTSTRASTSSTSATAPPVTSSATRHPTAGRGQDNSKKKGKP
jgi:eukaryotic-like serine/threonine-protein kinase